MLKPATLNEECKFSDPSCWIDLCCEQCAEEILRERNDPLVNLGVTARLSGAVVPSATQVFVIETHSKRLGINPKLSFGSKEEITHHINMLKEQK